MAQQKLGPAHVGQSRTVPSQDTSKYGNFDADDLCIRLETLKAQQKIGRAKREQRRREKGARLTPTVDKSSILRQTETHKPRKPETTDARQNIRASADVNISRQSKMGAGKGVPKEPSPRNASAYVPQSAALAFTKTTTTDGQDRRRLLGKFSMIFPENTVVKENKNRGSMNHPESAHREATDSLAQRHSLDVEKDKRYLDRTNPESLAEAEEEEKAVILAGPLYDVPRTRKWVQDDEKMPISRSAPEKTGLREKLSHLRLISPKLRLTQMLDNSDQEILDAHGASRRKSMIFSMFK